MCHFDLFERTQNNLRRVLELIFDPLFTVSVYIKLAMP
jgi:hypothetical protein